jgi:DNA-binding MarR family transcriptional regulator
MNEQSDDDGGRMLLIDLIEKSVFRIYWSLRQQPALRNMSPQDPVLLKQIDRRPGIGLGELARLERLRAPTITAHISRLEAAGLVRKASVRSDGRRVGLHTTAQGRRAIALATKARHQFIADRLGALTAAEIETLAAAAPILIKLGDDPAQATIPDPCSRALDQRTVEMTQSGAKSSEQTL